MTGYTRIAWLCILLALCSNLNFMSGLRGPEVQLDCLFVPLPSDHIEYISFPSLHESLFKWPVEDGMRATPAGLLGPRL